MQYYLIYFLQENLESVIPWCKGCGVCVGFCPVKVLEIKDDKCVIAHRDKCIFCGQCELRCPDNAIWIGGKK
jgi:2-oxoglutarate ferredoxin oxidoreductase subunit delta